MVVPLRSLRILIPFNFPLRRVSAIGREESARLWGLHTAHSTRGPQITENYLGRHIFVTRPCSRRAGRAGAHADIAIEFLFLTIVDMRRVVRRTVAKARSA